FTWFVALLGGQILAGVDGGAVTASRKLGDGAQRCVRIVPERGDRARACVRGPGGAAAGLVFLRRRPEALRRRPRRRPRFFWSSKSGSTSGLEFRSNGASTAAKICAAAFGCRLRALRLVRISVRSEAGSNMSAISCGGGESNGRGRCGGYPQL